MMSLHPGLCHNQPADISANWTDYMTDQFNLIETLSAVYIDFFFNLTPQTQI